MEVLLAFAAALLALRLAGPSRAAGACAARRSCSPGARRSSRTPSPSAALAWGAAHGWDARAFRVYYLFGGLLTAPLLGAGSLLIWRRRCGGAGRARLRRDRGRDRDRGAGARSSRQRHSGGAGSPRVRARPTGRDRGQQPRHAAVVIVAAATFRRRPLGNALIVLGVAIAAAGTAVAGLGVRNRRFRSCSGSRLVRGLFAIALIFALSALNTFSYTSSCCNAVCYSPARSNVMRTLRLTLSSRCWPLRSPLLGVPSATAVTTSGRLQVDGNVVQGDPSLSREDADAPARHGRRPRAVLELRGAAAEPQARSGGLAQAGGRRSSGAYPAGPPHKWAWLCIHRYEGAWTRQRRPVLRRPADGHRLPARATAGTSSAKGTAEHWTPLEQMWVAERAYRSGRGFYPWPNTARACGLI